jgi:hypothetical protein
MENDGPYLSLVVVTHHDTNPGLFNTKFRLNFGRSAVNPQIAAALTDEELNTIVIGRSSSCAMVLDYRTVSTTHAKITFSNGNFFLTDERSSNGTLVYLQDPLPLPYGQNVKIRMGRTTIALQAKRSWSAAIRSFLFGSGPNNHPNNNNNNNHHQQGTNTHDDPVFQHAIDRGSVTTIGTGHVDANISMDNTTGQCSFLGHGLPSPPELQTFIAAITASLNDVKLEANSTHINLNSTNNNNNNNFSTNSGHGLVPNDSNNNLNNSNNNNNNELTEFTAAGIPPQQLQLLPGLLPPDSAVYIGQVNQDSMMSDLSPTQPFRIGNRINTLPFGMDYDDSIDDSATVDNSVAVRSTQHSGRYNAISQGFNNTRNSPIILTSQLEGSADSRILEQLDHEDQAYYLASGGFEHGILLAAENNNNMKSPYNLEKQSSSSTNENGHGSPTKPMTTISTDTHGDVMVSSSRGIREGSGIFIIQQNRDDNLSDNYHINHDISPRLTTSGRGTIISPNTEELLNNSTIINNSNNNNNNEGADDLFKTPVAGKFAMPQRNSYHSRSETPNDFVTNANSIAGTNTNSLATLPMIGAPYSPSTNNTNNNNSAVNHTATLMIHRLMESATSTISNNNHRNKNNNNNNNEEVKEEEEKELEHKEEI